MMSTDLLKRVIVDAMDDSEGIGAPEGVEYIELMSFISNEALSRMVQYGDQAGLKKEVRCHLEDLLERIGNDIGVSGLE